MSRRVRVSHLLMSSCPVELLILAWALQLCHAYLLFA